MTPTEAPPEARPRRILHVISTLRPEDGGPPESVRQMSRNYLLMGDQVEVVTLDAVDAPFLNNIGFPVHALGPARIKYGLSRRLVRWLFANARRFDLIVINGVWLFHAVAASRAARGAKVPYVVFTHGALDVFFRRRYPAKHVKKMIYWPLQYKILKQAQAVLFTSTSERDLAAASFWPNKWTSRVVPYGTNKPGGNRDRQATAFLELYPQLQGRRFLLFLSRIHEKKGCDLLIQAFATIAEAEPELDLVIAGPDQAGLASKLKEQDRLLGVADRILWPGMLSGDAKAGAFLAADAFILPSHQENFGIVVAEALAFGTPVLISDQVNIWRDIDADNAGMVEPDTLEGTCRLLNRWLRLTPAERQSMQANAARTFEARYSMRRTAEVIHSLAQPKELDARRLGLVG